MKVYQRNLNRQHNAADQLLHLVSKSKQFILLLQEMPVSKTGNVIGWYNCRKHFSRDPSPRSCIITSYDVDAWLDPKFTSRDITTCLFQDIYFASVYLDINKREDAFFPPELHKLLHHAYNNNVPIILGIDSNAHSQLWGNESNGRGAVMEEFIASNDLAIANYAAPTYVVRRGDTHIETSIDITLGRGVNIHNWNLLSGSTGSDHRVIEFGVDIQTYDTATKVNLNTTNWTKVNHTLGTVLKTNLPERVSATWIDNRVDFITESINNAVRDASRLIRRNQKGIKPPYWNSDLHKLRNNMRLYWSKYKHKKTNQGWTLFANARTLYRQGLE